MNATALTVRGYNIPVGAVISGAPSLPDPGTGAWVVTRVGRDFDQEIVELGVLLHDDSVGDEDTGVVYVGFCDPVDVVGFSANPAESDDTDYGVGV